MQRKYRFLWLALIIPLGAVGAFATGLVPMPWQASKETPQATAGRVVAPAEAEKTVKQVAVQTPAKQSPPTASKRPADTAAKPKLAFGIDVARLNGDGSSVIAGYGKPGKAMTLMADGKPVGVVTPDQQGDWVLVTAYKFAHLDPKLSLKFGNHLRKTVAAVNNAPATSAPKVRRDTAPASPAVTAQPQPTKPPPPKRRAAEVTEQMLERLKKLTKEAEARSEADATKPPAKSEQKVASAQLTPARPETTSKTVAPEPSKPAATTAPKPPQKVAALTNQPAAAAPTTPPRKTPKAAEPAQQTGKTEPEATAKPNAAADAPVKTQSEAKAPSAAKAASEDKTRGEDKAQAVDKAVVAPAPSARTTEQARPAAPAKPVSPVAPAAPRETAEAPKVKPDETAKTTPPTAARETVKVAKAPTTAPSVTVKPPVDAPRATEQATVAAPQTGTEAPVKTPSDATKVATATPTARAKLPAPSEASRARVEATASPSDSAKAEPAKAADEDKGTTNQKVAAATPAPAKAPPSDVANLPVPVQFVYRKAELTPKGREAAALLLKYFLAKDFKYVVLSGHADERGTNQANMILSKQRLLRIKRLLREGGFEGRLKLVPKGETEKYTGVDRSQFDTEELWQLDRRVEVVSASAG